VARLAVAAASDIRLDATCRQVAGGFRDRMIVGMYRERPRATATVSAGAAPVPANRSYGYPERSRSSRSPSVVLLALHLRQEIRLAAYRQKLRPVPLTHLLGGLPTSTILHPTSARET
jgi:hypothetical protein